MALTAKQEAFCLAYIETGNASEAYRRCYETVNTKPETVNRNAKVLLDNDKIATRLEELRRPAVEAAQVTLEGHLRRLEELSRKAEQEGKYAAAITAEISRGKASGLYVEKVEHSGEIKTPELKLVLHGTKPSPAADGGHPLPGN
jgi:phage terminase small subunit